MIVQATICKYLFLTRLLEWIYFHWNLIKCFYIHDWWLYITGWNDDIHERSNNNLSRTWWRHQMKYFPRYWSFVRGIHRSPVNFPHKVQWRGVLKFSLICAWTNGWVNNRDAGDLRRHRAHFDVTIMEDGQCQWGATWRCLGMETVSALLAICEGNPPVTGFIFDISLNKRLNKHSNKHSAIWDAMTLIVTSV